MTFLKIDFIATCSIALVPKFMLAMRLRKKKRGWDLLEQPNHSTWSSRLFFPVEHSLSCTIFPMDTLTSHTRPTTDATITVRCIKSFEYRTCKSLVLQHLNLETTTVGELKSLVRESKTLLEAHTHLLDLTHT